MSLLRLLFVTSLLTIGALCAYDAYIFYPSGATDCTGTYSSLLAITSTVCSANTCTCSTGVGCFARKCALADLPAGPSNAIVAAVYSKADCTGEASVYTATVNNQCYTTTASLTGSGPAARYSCSNGMITYETWISSSSCTGVPTSSLSTNVGTSTYCLNGVYYNCGAPVNPTPAPTTSISDTNSAVSLAVGVSSFGPMIGFNINSMSIAVATTATTAGRISFDVTLSSGTTNDQVCTKLVNRLYALAPVLTRSPCDSKCVTCRFTSKRGEDASGEMTAAPAYAGVASNTVSLFAFLLVLLCFVA